MKMRRATIQGIVRTMQLTVLETMLVAILKAVIQIRRAILKAVIQIRRASLMLMMILMIKRVREKVKMGLSLNQHSLSSLLYSPWPPDCICKKLLKTNFGSYQDSKVLEVDRNIVHRDRGLMNFGILESK